MSETVHNGSCEPRPLSRPPQPEHCPIQRPTPSQSCAASATPLSISTSTELLLKPLSSHPATTRPASRPDSLSVPTPGHASPASKPGPTTSSCKLPRPRITSQGWNVEELCSKFENFEPVRRAHACSESLTATLLGYERDGIPLIVDHWEEHPAWPQDIFNLEWLLRTSGEKQINTRNVHDRRDHNMTLREFVDISRKQSRHSVAGEAQRLYWKDADCPREWRKWLLHSGAVPANVLPGVVNPDDYLGYLSESEAVESLLCYMGIGDTYTAAHKDLCASSGHNLMCFSEQGGSSYWFMTAANDAPAVAAYFNRELRQELDWETHVTTIEELGRAPFKVYVAEQKVGDLVLVPPRSCHQVVNYGGLAMKTSWSRMTLDNLTTAIRYELPIYRRVCRPEQYRVKTILYRSVLHLTEQLQKALAFAPQSALKAEPLSELAVCLNEEEEIRQELSIDPTSFGNLVDYTDSSPGSRDPTPAANVDTADRAKKLRRLVELFDEVLREEFARCYTELDHIFRSESGTGRGITSGLTPSAGNDGGRAASSGLSNGFKLRLQPPADVEDRRNGDRARERTASCNLACDFCGADIFQSFFECKSCRTPEESTTPSIGDGLLICPSCYVEGRACHCSDMEPRQCRPFEMLLSDRNDAAHVLSRVLPPAEQVSVINTQDLLRPGTLCIFEAAHALCSYRKNHRDKLLETRKCRHDAIHAGGHGHTILFDEGLNCAQCHSTKCFYHLLEVGTHSSEAILAYSTRGTTHETWHNFHRRNALAAKASGAAKKLFDLDGEPSLLGRLRIAARSFNTCRPGHTNIRLGYYDEEGGPIDLYSDDVSATALEASPPAGVLAINVPPVEPIDVDAQPEDDLRGVSPLTPVDSAESLLGSSPMTGPRQPSASVQPTVSALPIEAAVDNDGVIEVSYTSDSLSSVREHLIPDEKDDGYEVSSRASAIRTGQVYVSLPPMPQYASGPKKDSVAPIPSREPPDPIRQKPRGAKHDDEEVPSRARGKDQGEKVARPSTARRLSRAKSVRVDPANESATGLAKALEQAGRSSIVSQVPPPKAIKKPMYARARPSTIPRIMSETESESDSPPSASPAPRPKPPAKTASVPSTATSTTVARIAPRKSIAPPPSPAPGQVIRKQTLPLPRTNTLKRPRPEESGDTDKPGSRIMAVASSSSAKANKSMDLGPVPKKAKKPPGIPAAELAAHREAVPAARAKKADKISSTDNRKATRIEPPPRRVNAPPPHAHPPNAPPPNVLSLDTDAAAVAASQAVAITQAPEPVVSTGPAPAPVPVPAPPTSPSVDAAPPQAPTPSHVAAPALAVQHSLQPTISTAVVPVPHPPSAASTSLGPAMDIDSGTGDVGSRLLMLQDMMSTVSAGFSSVVQDLRQSLPDRATNDQMFNHLSQRLDALEAENFRLATENMKLRDDVILLADAKDALQGQHKHTVSQLESLKQEMVELRGLHSVEMPTRCSMSYKMEETSKDLGKLCAMFYEKAHAQALAQVQAGVDASSPSFSPVTPGAPEHAKVAPHGWPTVSQLGGKAPPYSPAPPAYHRPPLEKTMEVHEAYSEFVNSRPPPLENNGQPWRGPRGGPVRGGLPRQLQKPPVSHEQQQQQQQRAHGPPQRGPGDSHNGRNGRPHDDSGGHRGGYNYRHRYDRDRGRGWERERERDERRHSPDDRRRGRSRSRRSASPRRREREFDQGAQKEDTPSTSVHEDAARGGSREFPSSSSSSRGGAFGEQGSGASRSPLPFPPPFPAPPPPPPALSWR